MFYFNLFYDAYTPSSYSNTDSYTSGIVQASSYSEASTSYHTAYTPIAEVLHGFFAHEFFSSHVKIFIDITAYRDKGEVKIILHVGKNE